MRLGPYELVSRIGAGGMGEVWSARRSSVAAGELLAIKRLPESMARDPNYRRLLLDEARLSMLLGHRNIVHVFDAGEANGEAYIAMEFVRGLDLSRLRKLLDQTGEQLSPVVCAYVIGEVLQGLTYAHNLEHRGELISLVHRDVSPHNVILSVRGEVKLTDFGVARLSSEDTSGTHVKGKARYMPPEQLRGESRSPTVDLFAAGAVLHEMLDGRMFRYEAVDDARLLGMAIDGVVPKLRRRIAGAVEDLRVGLLEPDPELRIHSAHAALDLLYRWPQYRDASAELGSIVQRYLEMSAALDEHPRLDEDSPHALGEQPTLLHANDGPGERANVGTRGRASGGPGGRANVDRDAVSLEDLLGSGEFTSDERMFTDGSERPLDGGFGPVEHIDNDVDRPSVRKTGPWGALGTTAGSTAGRAPEHDTEPKLEVERPGASFTRHVATSPNPIVKPRPIARWIGLSLGLVALGLGGWLARDLIAERPKTHNPPPPQISEGMRKVRVIGDDFAGHVGFRMRNMDKLASDDILYTFVDGAADGSSPLAALAADEAEFALISLDQLLLARAGLQPGAPSLGKIVAVVDVSLGGDALLVDSKEHPQLRSLADLASFAAKSKQLPGIAHAAATPSAYLDLRLDALLVSLDEPGLRHLDSFSDVRAVHDALLASDEGRDPIVAAWLREPWLGQAVDAGLTVVASSRDLPATVVDVLIASPKLVAEQPELIQTIVATYYTGIVAQQRNPEELLAAIARELGLTPAEAERALAGQCLLDAVGAEPWLIGQDGAPPLLGAAIDATWTTLRSHGRVDGPAPQLEDLVDARALIAAAASARAAQTEPTPGSLAQCLAAGDPSSSGTQDLGALELPSREQPWFLPGDATLSSARAADVAALTTHLASFNPRTVEVEIFGYGDAGQGGKSLAQARAQALVDALTRSGVALTMRSRAGSGRQQPAALIDLRLSRSR